MDTSQATTSSGQSVRLWLVSSTRPATHPSLPRGSSALTRRPDSGGALSPSKKRKSEDVSARPATGSTSAEGLTERGGAAALASYDKGAKKADWPAALKRVHGIGQCVTVLSLGAGSVRTAWPLPVRTSRFR